MPVHNFPYPRLLCLSTIPCLLITGCANHHAMVLDSQSEPLAATSPSADILSELGILNANTEIAQATEPMGVGPQLVAGDWLAWQCAYAGSYWDSPLQSTERSEYAEAHEAELGHYELDR